MISSFGDVLIRNCTILVLLLTCSLADRLIFNHDLKGDFLDIDSQQWAETVVQQWRALVIHVKIFIIFCSLSTIDLWVLVIVNGLFSARCLFSKELRFRFDTSWFGSCAFQLWDSQSAGIASKLIDAGNHEVSPVYEVFWFRLRLLIC